MTTLAPPSSYGLTPSHYSGYTSTGTSRPLGIDPRYIAYSGRRPSAPSTTSTLLSALGGQQQLTPTHGTGVTGGLSSLSFQPHSSGTHGATSTAPSGGGRFDRRPIETPRPSSIDGRSDGDTSYPRRTVPRHDTLTALSWLTTPYTPLHPVSVPPEVRPASPRRAYPRRDGTTRMPFESTAPSASHTYPSSSGLQPSARPSASSNPYRLRPSQSGQSTAAHRRRGALRRSSAYSLNSSRPLTSFPTEWTDDDKPRKPKGTSFFLQTKGKTLIAHTYDHKSRVTTVGLRTGADDEAEGSYEIRRYMGKVLVESCRLHSDGQIVPGSLFNTHRVPTSIYQPVFTSEHHDGLSTRGTFDRTATRVTWGHARRRLIPRVGKGRPVKQRG